MMASMILNTGRVRYSGNTLTLDGSGARRGKAFINIDERGLEVKLATGAVFKAAGTELVRV